MKITSPNLHSRKQDEMSDNDEENTTSTLKSEDNPSITSYIFDTIDDEQNTCQATQRYQQIQNIKSISRTWKHRLINTCS